MLLEVYLAPLAFAMAAFHLDRFDFGKLISYGFLVIAFGMTAVAGYFLVRQPPIVADDDRDVVASSIASRVVLVGIAAIVLAWGATLFVTDNGPSELVWAWPGDLLSSRLIGVMLLAIGAGSVYALPRADTARLMEITTVVYATGLAAASLWSSVLAKPVKPAYVGVFTVIAAACVLVLIVDRPVPTASTNAPTPGSRRRGITRGGG